MLVFLYEKKNVSFITKKIDSSFSKVAFKASKMINYKEGALLLIAFIAIDTDSMI